LDGVGAATGADFFIVTGATFLHGKHVVYFSLEVSKKKKLKNI
jgi:hypothetical protein